jgi:membrane AbrB-like protein
MQTILRRVPWRLAPVYAGALALGAVLEWLHMPLPWMIGALVFSMTLSMSGVAINPPRITRIIGQMSIAASVGLSFTPAAVAIVSAMLLPMLLSAVATIAAGFVVSMVLMRLAHLDAVSAMLSSVPIGPVETANLAQAYGVPAAPVVFAQTMRIVLLIVIIPPLLIWIDGSVSDPSAALRAIPWRPDGALLLVVVAILGAIVGRIVRLSNPFFIGPLAGAAVAAAFSLPITGLPYPLLAGAQVLLGVFLGATFDREFLGRARAFIPAAFVSTLLLMVLCGALGLALTPWTGEAWQVMILATAPGSITEMALTAKVLQQGIAVVTAFHVLRVMIMMPMAPVIFRVATRVARHYGIGADAPRD